ncbi:drebrin isoform X2 [Betta splendens]|uniref:Drebrin n=1 Tax=Betta splendens TaxID=158456 RepID=A0A6P7NF23_BETSP|nr:drebrin isoform X2 [Betta splendens]
MNLRSFGGTFLGRARTSPPSAVRRRSPAARKPPGPVRSEAAGAVRETFSFFFATMSARPVNLDTYSLSLLTAKEDIVNPRSSTNWALFAYDGVTNNLKLADSGAGGAAELAAKFHVSRPEYGLCKIQTAETGSPRIALFSWVGQSVDDYRRAECASHIPAIKSFFKEAAVFINAEKVEDVTEEKIRSELLRTSAHASSQWARRSSRSVDNEEIVGTNYRKTNAAMEMRLINRDSFWARAEREEEERKDEERRRALEERRRLERERVMKERRDAEERDRKMDEKLQMIEEQRRQEAEQEEELRKKEKFKWEQQQREHEEDMRARLRRSESIEKAAEAAALVSQRSMNPREFFRQLSSSSSPSPTSPGSSRSGKPFRRYQRSLTDTAFIFCKAEEGTASSPRSPPLVSPFSRSPRSPFYRATSPPASPDFRPAASPLGPRAPVSPPASPARPPSAGLQADNRVQAAVEPRAPSPTEPSAPPASPTLLVPSSPTLVTNSLSQSRSEDLPAPPPSSPTLAHAAFCFAADLPPQALNAPPPEKPQSNTDLGGASHVHADASYLAQAVLVEEDEEEEEEAEEREDDAPETRPPASAASTESAQTEAEEQEEGERGEEEEQGEEEEKEGEEEAGSKQEAEASPPEEPEEEVEEEEEADEDQEENDVSEASQAPAELPEVTEPLWEEIKHEPVVLTANGITNGDDVQEQNGTERSLSPSDTELTSQVLSACYNLHVTPEEDDIDENEEEDKEEEEEEISENGKEI